MSLFSELLNRTKDDAGCAVWQRSCCNGHPAFRRNGKTLLVRREIWKDEHGEIAPGQIIAMQCETALCIEPEHMQATTHQRLAKKNGALGLMSGPVRSAKIAATKRKSQAKLTAAMVLEIRQSNEKTKTLAEKFGVAQAHISKIRVGKCWRDFSSPWAGL